MSNKNLVVEYLSIISLLRIGTFKRDAIPQENGSVSYVIVGQSVTDDVGREKNMKNVTYMQER